MLRKLWNDEAGFIISAELVLVATIVVIGLICGLVCIRNQIVQELCDVGQAIGALSQSYCFSGCVGQHDDGPVWCKVSGTCFEDVRDFCQPSKKQKPGDPIGGLSCSGDFVNEKGSHTGF